MRLYRSTVTPPSAPADRVPCRELADPEAALDGPARDPDRRWSRPGSAATAGGAGRAALLGQEEPLEQVSQLLRRHEEVELEKGVAQAEPGLSTARPGAH